MEPALKQRLLGAAVLVALAIIFLPMLFDGPAAPPPPAGSLPLTVPASPDRPLQTREIPLALPSRTPPASPVASAPSSEAIAEPDRLPMVDVPPSPRVEVPEDQPATSSVTQPPQPISAPAVAPVPQPAAPVATAPVQQPAVPVASAPVPASESKPSPPAPTPALAATPAGNRFVVNLGSYSNAANAQALLGRLKAGGVIAYSESIALDGKSATRLRAGPFASRAAAESAAVAVRKIQSDAPTAVIGLESSDAAPARQAPAVAGGFIVQVAAFKDEAEANALRDRLRTGGYSAFVERIARDGGALWRVRVGPEIQRAKAESTQAALKQRFALDGQVLTYP